MIHSIQNLTFEEKRNEKPTRKDAAHSSRQHRSCGIRGDCKSYGFQAGRRNPGTHLQRQIRYQPQLHSRRSTGCREEADGARRRRVPGSGALGDSGREPRVVRRVVDRENNTQPDKLCIIFLLIF